MDLADCYRLLGLRTGASYEDIKSAYRRLARQYHPDANPGSPQQANDKFIQLTEAYRKLINVVQPSRNSQGTAGQTKPQSASTNPSVTRSPASPPLKGKPEVKVTRKSPPIEFTEDMSVTDRQLKTSSYEQLQQLLRDQRYPRAITLVEGLAQRLPNDAEVRQWQAITYQRFGRYLVAMKEGEKARVYLKKALRTDPHNKSLWYEVDRDFRRLEQVEIY
ncbi:MAG: J domain-containing protein [Oculatellaceae cyanobacterium Prado106]|jgi:curved DNA-binding protein CbpA|nr:J domain-containing protein [Oculatellaceae cyanobacterium Prado106]